MTPWGSLLPLFTHANTRSPPTPSSSVYVSEPRPLATPPADGVTVVYSTFDALANVRVPNEICPRLSVARGASSNVTRPQADNASTSRATRNGANHRTFFIIDPSRH